MRAIRGDFPALASGVAFFDGPGGTQAPRVVGDAIAAALTGPLSNRGRQTVGARNDLIGTRPPLASIVEEAHAAGALEAHEDVDRLLTALS